MAIDKLDQATRCIELVADGALLPTAAETAGLSITAFMALLSEYPQLSQAYGRAQQSRAEVLAQEIIEIADGDDDPQKARNRVQVRQWLASKFNPRKYGERLDVNIEQRIDISAVLAEARARVALPGSYQQLPEQADVPTLPAVSADSARDNKSQAEPSEADQAIKQLLE